MKSYENHPIYTMPFTKVYPCYITKAEKKGKTKKDVDTLIFWLTGYDQKGLDKVLEDETDIQTFFDQAPKMNASMHLITGVVCGVRIEDIEHPLMRNIRYMDKLIDELARGKEMESIMRK